ncbi:hypothetical protein ABIF65_005575 [Bradyrhizobium japonicum]|jgi:hypothetical protein|nr:hypothetical protein [Bradyrhizobium japonicum]MCP1782198.1 hypothetical protein [Bradyrhizobium japonicum]MCP1861618.1 hypothetical protein [Bradyrhizobium japonicum]MCP1892377.1 hypothetical protein [Bradyrhizobium japonicum]MCP1965514.1 hypothetical protein [Bradyrhizobium japonicum]
MAFQGKKPEALGVKAPFPGFIEPALAASIDRVPSGERGSMKSSSTAIVSRCISLTK